MLSIFTLFYLDGGRTPPPLIVDMWTKSRGFFYALPKFGKYILDQLFSTSAHLPPPPNNEMSTFKLFSSKSSSPSSTRSSNRVPSMRFTSSNWTPSIWPRFPFSIPSNLGLLFYNQYYNIIWRQNNFVSFALILDNSNELLLYLVLTII